MNVAVILAARLGFGKHFRDVDPANVEMYFKVRKPDFPPLGRVSPRSGSLTVLLSCISTQLVIVCSTTYSCGITLAKASFAVLYLRLLDSGGLWHIRLNQCVLVFLFCQAIEETCTVIFQCRPLQKAWEPEIEGYCIPLEPIWYTGVGRATAPGPDERS
jgi:hypothetical protein